MKARIITIVAAAFLALGACKPEVGPIGPSYEAGAGILGTWELTMVEQTDVTLPVPETRDVSDLYLDAQNKWVVAFNSDSTYSVNQQGPGFDVFGNGGTWLGHGWPNCQPRCGRMSCTDCRCAVCNHVRPYADWPDAATEGVHDASSAGTVAKVIKKY